MKGIALFIALLSILNVHAQDESKHALYKQEVATLTKEISNDPGNLSLYNKRGIAYHNSNDIASANRDYAKVIELYNSKRDIKYKDEVVSAYYKLADDYFYRRSSLSKALEFIKRGLKVSPGNKKLEILEAVILGSYLEKGDLAKTKFEKAIGKYPNDEKLNLQYAKFLEKEDMAVAITYYEKAFAINPSNADVLFTLGAYYINEASQMYTSADLDLSKVYESTRKGVDYLEKLLQLHPADKEVMEILVEYYTYLGRDDDANEMERKLHK